MSRNREDSECSDIVLSEEASAALMEFLREQEIRQNEEEALINTGNAEKALEVEHQEDWNLSQFWYDEPTCEALEKIILSIYEPGMKIGCISSPTCFKHLLKCKNFESQSE
ncbi:Oidioi.mRNA.OKI2018_I69.chr2.g7227.t1.cds [Oikopleura dioica]|uniref:Oidioi.mRNA.OKI2018_I69.chr2.g7227.t1.cds n=1 Tax=Oikopleura dioica TaxID=34765 RepID=A0ABN7T649_OIKDI|nr:Oidioi.mRNA.OKI2018_I69.chr2.g7227.t1.cds [Oikopleura dioica]